MLRYSPGDHHSLVQRVLAFFFPQLEARWPYAPQLKSSAVCYSTVEVVCSEVNTGRSVMDVLP